MQSTHLIDYGPGKSAALAVVCGNYCRTLRQYVFGGTIAITAWKRLPVGATLIPCVSPMVEREGSGMINTSDNL